MFGIAFHKCLSIYRVEEKHKKSFEVFGIAFQKSRRVEAETEFLRSQNGVTFGDQFLRLGIDASFLVKNSINFSDLGIDW